MKNNPPYPSLKQQGYNSPSLNPKSHPLPGQWAQEQLSGKSSPGSRMTSGSGSSTNRIGHTELARELQKESARHTYWENWQGVKPGLPAYEDPRSTFDGIY